MRACTSASQWSREIFCTHAHQLQSVPNVTHGPFAHSDLTCALDGSCTVRIQLGCPACLTNLFWKFEPYGPVTLLCMRETYELRMKNHKIIFIRTKSPWKCRIVRILTVLNLWVAYDQRMSANDSVWPMYVQRVTSVWPAYSASCTLNTLLNRQAYAKMSIYVADTSDIR